MRQMPVLAAFRCLLLSVILTPCLANLALAQTSEGSTQLRFGAFTQFGHTILDGATGGVSGNASTKPFGGGATAGIDFVRRGGWMYGLEGDFGTTGGAKASIVGARFGADYFSSLRGRAGYYIRPDWLMYGTGGIGFRGISITETNGARTEKTLTGGVLGFGTEWHRGGTVFFAEYLHSQYATQGVAVNTTSSLTNTVINSDQYTVGGRSDAIRVGVKFKLGYDGYYDDVREGLRR